MARFANEAPLHAGSRPKRRLGVGPRDVAGTVIRRRDPFKQEELTPQNFQIGIAVATGRTNCEVSAAFFISTKTVEKHLSSRYRKLGIRSRVELARLQLTEPNSLTPSARPDS